MEKLQNLLGKRVIDKETEYQGKVTGYAVYTSGYKAVLVEALDTTNRPIEQWVDINRIEKY